MVPFKSLTDHRGQRTQCICLLNHVLKNWSLYSSVLCHVWYQNIWCPTRFWKKKECKWVETINQVDMHLLCFINYSCLIYYHHHHSSFIHYLWGCKDLGLTELKFWASIQFPCKVQTKLVFTLKSTIQGVSLDIYYF